MRRILLYSHLDTPLGELSTNDVFACIRREEINGEHSLEITTSRVLEKGQRIVYQDGRGIWREYVVSGIDEEHNAGRTVVGMYYCVWSLQYDLLGVNVSKMPGVQTPVSAGVALEDALSEQMRWTRGTAHTGTGGASMYDMSAWQAMGVLVDNWGGELETAITVSTTLPGIVSRTVNLPAQIGEQTVKRRFDFGADLKSITRTLPDSPLYCRISPRGKGEETEGGGFGRKIRISSVNGGLDYLEYAPMVDVAKLPDGNGGYQYPTLIIENADCETPADLKAWAQSVLVETLTPKITYKADVIQAAREGIDLQGVSLGDAVDIVDRSFRADGLRATGRVVSVEVDEITGRNDTLEIGAIEEKLASKFSNDGSIALNAVNSLASSLSTAAYIDSLLARINADINATGGYTYITQGQGIRTYDTAVTDPLIGAEASQVVEVKGGNIRIANTKDAQGNWKWRTVLQSGLIASDVLTANNIITGNIGSPSGNYWNLDTGEMRLLSTTTVGGQTVGTIASNAASSAVNGQTQADIFNKLTNNGAVQGLVMDNGQLYVNASYINSGVLRVADGNSNVIFEANINNGLVTIGGFTVDQYALYNGLSTLLGTSAGVYVGTNGVATSNGTESIAFSGGGIQGYKNGEAAGYISPTATAEEHDGDTTVTRLGLQIRGDAIDIRTPHLTVSNTNSTSGDSTHTLTQNLTYHEVSLTNATTKGVTLRPYTTINKYVCGMLTSMSYTSPTSRTVALQSYAEALEARIAALENAGYITQSDLNGYATESWVTGQNYATTSQLPQFTLDGTTLRITN